MRRLTLILLSVLLVTCLFVSCDVEKNVREGDTVTLRFRTDDNGRALTATREDLDTTKYYWYYTATKSENDKTPATGRTTKPTAVTKSSDGDAEGLSGIVGPFSLGTWNFELYAYTEAQTFGDSTGGSTTYITEKCVYYGKTAEAGYVLGEDTETIDITVSPQKATDGTGNLYIKKGINFTANGKTYNATNVVIESVNGVTPETVDSPDDTTYWKFSNRAVGSYKVTVSYKDGDITCATNTIYVNVWNNLTTTISGTLDEIKVSPTFNAVEDPSTGAISQVANVQDKTEAVYEFDYSPASNEYSGSSNELGTTVKGAFAFDTDRSSATLTVTTYNLVSSSADRKATFTVESNNSAVAAVTATLEGATLVADSTVKVKTYISKDLTDVKMYHSNVAMDEAAKTSADKVTANGNWYYDKTTGLLVFATSSFSTFHVTSSVNVYDKDNNTAYTLAKNGNASTEYMIKNSNGTTKSAGDLGSNLVLLDCSLSNNVPDEFTSKNWEVVHKNCSEAENCYHSWNKADFSGGWGTKVEPYLIANKEEFQNITNMYDKYAYYKIKEGVEEIDCFGWTAVRLFGSFNGNGVKLKNVDQTLFYFVGKLPEKEAAATADGWDTTDITLKDFEANCNFEKDLDISAGLIFQINGNNTTTLDNVTVSGRMVGGSNSGVFFSYTGPNYYDKDPGLSQKVVLDDCAVTADIISVNGSLGIIAGYPGYCNNNIVVESDKAIGVILTSGTAYTTSGEASVFAVSGGYKAIGDTSNKNFITYIEGNITKDSNYSIKCQTLTKADSTYVENSGYSVAWSGDATRMEAYITAQLSETDPETKAKTSTQGITLSLTKWGDSIAKSGSETSAVVLKDVKSITVSPKQDKYGATLSGSGELSCTTGGDTNYTFGTIKLQVIQYNGENKMVAYTIKEIGTLSYDDWKKGNAWTVKK